MRQKDSFPHHQTPRNIRAAGKYSECNRFDIKQNPDCFYFLTSDYSPIHISKIIVNVYVNDTCQ